MNQLAIDQYKAALEAVGYTVSPRPVERRWLDARVWRKRTKDLAYIKGEAGVYYDELRHCAGRLALAVNNYRRASLVQTDEERAAVADAAHQILDLLVRLKRIR